MNSIANNNKDNGIQFQRLNSQFQNITNEVASFSSQVNAIKSSAIGTIKRLDAISSDQVNTNTTLTQTIAKIADISKKMLQI